jgi:predicted PurR-regulated permease PerM
LRGQAALQLTNSCSTIFQGCRVLHLYEPANNLGDLPLDAVMTVLKESAQLSDSTQIIGQLTSMFDAIVSFASSDSAGNVFLYACTVILLVVFFVRYFNKFLCM